MSPAEIFIKEVLSGKHDQEIIRLLRYYEHYDSVIAEIIINMLDAHNIKGIEFSTSQKAALTAYINGELRKQRLKK